MNTPTAHAPIARPRAAQPGFSFEYLLWIFTRVSGVAMILLALVAFAAGIFVAPRSYNLSLIDLVRWTIFPNPNHVLTVPAEVQTWTNFFWKIMQILIAFLGITHGVNGLRNVAEDFGGHAIIRPFMRLLAILLWMFLMVMALYIILTPAG